MANYKFLVISGSLRKASLNTKLAKAFIAHAPEGTSIEFGDIGAVPLYNGDVALEAFPEPVTQLKNKIRAADGIVVITPEYNRSMPGVLKNVIDYVSRPSGDNAWIGKPVYIAGATDGRLGTAGAQTELRQVMTAVGAYVLGLPEFYLAGAKEKFDAEGNLIDDATKGFIDKALVAFATFVERLHA